MLTTSRSSLLSETTLETHRALCDTLDKAVAFLDELQETERKAILSERRSEIDTAALFVVVGEVKTGKSSFVNALLKENICEVDAAPCTATIQEITFGHEPKRQQIGPIWERIRLPKDVLREVTIVDTPGTNSVIQDHEVVTQRYLPKADLVIFSFLAQNPHNQSAWELFKRVNRDLQKKVVFVLQQSDRVTETEKETNKNRLEQYARERNIQNPSIFCVSSRLESETGEDSGFTLFRGYIRRLLESGEARKIKLTSIRNTGLTILQDLAGSLSNEHQQILADVHFFASLRSIIEERKSHAHRLKELIVNSLCHEYELLTQTLKQDFREGLNIGNLLWRSIPILRDNNIKDWLIALEKRFVERAERVLGKAIEQSSNDLLNEIERTRQSLLDSLRQRQTREAIRHFDEDRARIFSNFENNVTQVDFATMFADLINQNQSLVDKTVIGGGLGIIGIVIMCITHMIVIDITGGVLTAAGLTIATVTLIWKRSKVAEDFDQKINSSVHDFRSRLHNELTSVLDRLFFEFDHFADQSEERLKASKHALEERSQKCAELIQLISSLDL